MPTKTRMVFFDGPSGPEAVRAEARYDQVAPTQAASFGLTCTLFSHERVAHEETVVNPHGRTLWCYGGGCNHVVIAKRFPDWRWLLKWHLVSDDQPLHYVANTLYWLGHAGYCDGGDNDPPNLLYAASSCVLGVLDNDPPAKVLMEFSKLEAKLFLEQRLPDVMAKFREAMARLFDEKEKR